MVLLSACARTPPPAAPPETLVLVASSATLPLLEQLVEGFEAQNPSISMRVEANSPARGVAQVKEGVVALALVAGPPPEGLWAAPIAVDAIAVVVHPDNPVEELTLAQLYDVFVGQIWHWSELGVRERSADDEIEVLSRQEGSRTRTAFETQVMAQGPGCQPIAAVKLGADPAEPLAVLERPPCEPEPVTSMALLRMDSAEVVEYVAEHPSAIGYVAHGHVSERVKALRVEGAPPTPAKVAEGSYRLSLPFYLIAADAAPSADKVSAQEPSGAARRFVDYCLGAKGQALVAQGYVPVRGR